MENEISKRLKRLRPSRTATMDEFKRARRSSTPPNTPVTLAHRQSAPLVQISPELLARFPQDFHTLFNNEQFFHVLQYAASNATNDHQFMHNVYAQLIQQFSNSVSPTSEACSSSGSTSTCPLTTRTGAQATNGSGSGNSSTTVARASGGASGATHRERKGGRSGAAQQAMRTLSPAHPSAVLSGVDDLLRPERFDRLMREITPDQHLQELHSWNPEDRSLNIFVKEEDKFTFHRHPVAQSTDCIRGKIGYSRGFHVWQIEWPERQRGTHAVVGVATKNAPLHAVGYTALIGTTNESYGWDITRRECHHDSKHTMTWRYPSNVRDMYHVPDKFYCMLDMDEGYMAFATDDEFLGVAFRNLKGKTLYPIVAAVWGHCEISMRYLGSLEPEPLSLSEMCRRRVRIQLGSVAAEQVDSLSIPPSLKKYLLYQQ